MMTELDIFNQLHYAKEDGFTEGLAKGEAKGKAEGLAKGEKLAKIETAKNLQNMGLSVTQISLATGLSEGEINNLINR
ncbi:MAG TPA: hypothetical protein DHU72_00750 [Rikenellaceae bacterium]|nr:hypothetical protein [Rikenellaceae bacterium]